jgi:hypothetical protein
VTTFPDYLAASEDDALAWWPRDDATFGPVRRHTARRAAAELWLERPWRLRVRREHMRPMTRDDCEAKAHADEVDVDEWADGCTCWQIEEEGWHFICAADHPDAIPVWRVAPIYGPVWWSRFRRRLRSLLYPHPQPVLWGGRVTRRTHWWDRLLTGRSWFLISGDYQAVRLDADAPAHLSRRALGQ